MLVIINQVKTLKKILIYLKVFQFSPSNGDTFLHVIVRLYQTDLHFFALKIWVYNAFSSCMKKERRCHHWQENRPVHSFYGTVAGWWIYNNNHWHFEFSFRVLHTQTPLSSFQLYNHFPATGFVRLVQFGFQEQQWSLAKWSTNVHFQAVAPSSEIPSKNSLEDRLKDWEMFVSRLLFLLRKFLTRSALRTG